jgi:hypothetical protein
MIKLSNASEPGVERDLGDRKIGLLDQSSGEVDAAGLRNSRGRRSQVLDKQSSKVSGTQTHVSGKSLHIAFVEATVED